jgi:hypothetical protein
MPRLCLLAAVLTALVLAGLATGGTGPRVRLTDPSPARVEGAGFHSRETVRVTLTTATLTRTRRIVAGPGGGFASVWAGVSVDPCAAWKVVATGNEGSSALAHSRPHACPPPPDR